MKKYIHDHLALVSPVACDFKVGDNVVFANEFGVLFEGREVIGFSGPEHPLFEYGKFIHLNNDCYWMPVSPASLTHQKSKVGSLPVSKDVMLRNGQQATYLFTDFWCRPHYQLENGVEVCCVELNGTYLHTLSGDDEPCTPLKHDYQPVSEVRYG